MSQLNRSVVPSERSVHPSLAQIEALVEFLEGNPALAKGFSRTQSARDRSRRSWEQLELQLNSMGGGTIKTSKQWMKYWSDKKSAVKKKGQHANRRRTVGGVAEAIDLTEVEERITMLMGGDGFSTGDSHLAIQPFGELSPNVHDIELSMRCEGSAASVLSPQITPPTVICSSPSILTETIDPLPEPIAGTNEDGVGAECGH